MDIKRSFLVKNGATVEIIVKIPDKKITEAERDELLHRFAEESRRLYLEIGNEINKVNKTL